MAEREEQMSYKKIFSVVNEHTASTVTGRYAISLAAACGAELVLYAAHKEGSSEITLKRTGRQMDNLEAIASKLDISVTRIIEVGNISILLPKRVDEQKADLTFYPLMPDEGYVAYFKRHTVHYLLKTIRSDLAIMRAISLAKSHPVNILVPLGKFIGDKERRLMFVSELARSFHAQVTLFHIFAERDAKVMPEDITLFRKQLQQQNLTVIERSARGDIVRSITVEAITRHNELIVIGASGRGILRRVFFGNLSSDVMHQPSCNTILFRSSLTKAP
jgi:nucleotide-binding universal stress UspA family protein